MTHAHRHALIAVFWIGCGGAPGTHPHDMSAAGHEQMAEREDAAASVAWSDAIAPTDPERATTEEHRRAAAAHRAAAAALTEAEASACVGIDEDDRDASPFDHRRDIASVEPLVRVVPAEQHRAEQHVVEGATIVVRAVRGLTAEWLQRVIDCHLARNAALGHDVPEMPDCPLVPRGVSARVRSTGSAFAVDLRSDEPATAEEILRRARSLVGP